MKHVVSAIMFAIAGVQAGSVVFAQPGYGHTSDHVRYTFGARRHMDTLADRLRREANAVCWEMYDNYRHEPGYHATYREMYTILEDAIHIHDLAHEAARHGTGHEDHIAKDLHDVDQLFHHVEDDIEHWTSRNHYHRHDLAHRMEQLEITLHHLMEDYGVRSKQSAPRPAGPDGPPAPVLLPPR